MKNKLPVENKFFKITPYKVEFKQIFNLDLPDFMNGLFGFDIYKFEDHLSTQGYSADSNTSLNDFIRKTYGENATKLISNILRHV